MGDQATQSADEKHDTEARRLGKHVWGDWLRVGVILLGIAGAAVWVRSEAKSEYEALSKRLDNIENVHLPEIQKHLGRIDTRLACLEASDREQWGLLDLLFTPGYKPNRRDFLAARKRADDACKAAKFGVVYYVGEGGELSLAYAGPKSELAEQLGMVAPEIELVKSKQSQANVEALVAKLAAQRDLPDDKTSLLHDRVNAAYSSLRKDETLIILGDQPNK